MTDGEDKFLKGLTKIMAQRELKDAPLSQAAGLSPSYIRDLKRGKAASPTLAKAEMIARAMGLELADIFAAAENSAEVQVVAIAGKVGAGARVPVFDAYEKGDGPQVSCPPGLTPNNVVAVEIEGDSMEPVYSAGDLLFYTRETHEGVPLEAIGKRCVCEDESGHGWVKVVREGREKLTFDLHSFNDSSAPMYGVKLRWAAPVRLHWPAELVQPV
ncbi:helix-turn-helix domain-containing protein [Roseovarius pacificus]|uniref:helix-turn-helix domain-containing protein n=1 Tax=Roseovarius pacificus TaxID=337701 RepID=UPI002A18CB69|nr:helix-turn-helix domain-containing protein [Roseovarius pacificus]